MGKIVKFCSTCDEGFAEKFSFCPNCANELSAFEMKPLKEKAAEKVEVSKPAVKATPAVEAKPVVDAKPAVKSKRTILEPIIAKEVTTSKPKADIDTEEFIFEPVDLIPEDDSAPEVVTAGDFEIDMPDEPLEEPPVFESPIVAEANGNGASASKDDAPADEFETVPAFTAPATEVEFETASDYEASTDTPYRIASNGNNAFGVTVISERNGGIKNGLLLGAFALIVCGFFGIMTFSLFNNLSEIPALDQDPNLLAYLNDTPMAVEEQEEKEKEGEKAGGGGGGGKNEKAPVPKGERPMMLKSPDPNFPPTSRSVRVTDPAIAINRAVQGPIDETNRPKGRVGDPGGLGDMDSDGPGSGGGMGSGDGKGAGPGKGDGFGPGSNGGMGGGDSGGIGPGSGNGGRPRTSSARPPQPPPAKGPSAPMRILSKPKPAYTEAARKVGLTGTVRLKVTFNANGTIGSIQPLKGLGHGLTEKAIAAARSIRFKPQLQNGRPIGVSKTLVYNFSIY